ncbi:unnamed protein product [Coffea canephora]|uniref:Glycosyltransferase n=1 Tax=Coffea canephora TaxID=49390 RepID=A0A068TYH6_COFCA|nr:unnamed protein product [Coffea canephora]
MASVDAAKLHALFLPYFAPSHMIPLVNVARLFAAQGVKVTILTTKYNAVLCQSSIAHATGLGHAISVHNLKFPSAELGIPEGIENFSAATTTEILWKVYMGVMHLQPAMEEFIEELSPHCIISDMFYPWTVDLAEKLKIPRILFYPNNFISHCLPHNLREYEPHKSVKSDSERFLIPGLPDRIEMKRSQLEDHMKTETPLAEVLRKVRASALRSFGSAFDTVYEFEPQYADYFGKVKGTKYWTIGPLFYFSNKEKTDNSADGKDGCLNWLDTQAPKRVLYVSFGSIAKFGDAQLHEIAIALEALNQPFIWVVRKRESNPDGQQESWLPDGFEERITKGNKGLIIRGWAPQLKILNHPAIGGFMTHCGWNSTMEAMTAGVPLISWPLFAEQFYNEKLLLEVLKVGVSVGADHYHASPIIEDPLVESKQIQAAINRLISSSEESQEIRDRAKEMAALAKRAVEEGGSSYQNLLDLIDALKSCAFSVNS